MASKALCLLCLLSASCSATFQTPNTPRGQSHSVWTSHYLLGAAGRREIDVRDYCASGRVSEISTGASFGTLALTLLTVGIYAPRVVTITCAAEQKR